MLLTRTLTLQTDGNCDIIDITAEVSQRLIEASINDGLVTVFITGSTAGITTIEYEPGVLADLQQMWQRIVPDNIPYKHDQTWHDGNGHAHVRASLLGASLAIPFKDKALLLGTWQQIVVVDFDNRPRTRQIILQISGD